MGRPRRAGRRSRLRGRGATATGRRRTASDHADRLRLAHALGAGRLRRFRRARLAGPGPAGPVRAGGAGRRRCRGRAAGRRRPATRPGRRPGPAAAPRRRGDEPLDPELLGVKVTTADGAPLALVWNYAIHGTTLGPRNLRLSGDVMGEASRRLEAALGAPALFVNGAVGDVSPARHG